MGADYKPGTVAKATVRGVPDVTVMAGYGTAEPRLRWLTTDERLVDANNDGWYFAFDVTDVRRLVVLDLAKITPAYADRPAHLVAYLRSFGSRAHDSIADQIEAQTKPTCIPEPGRFAVVQARCDAFERRVEWVHGDPTEFGNDWHTFGGSDDPYHRVWSDLIDPVLIREGVES